MFDLRHLSLLLIFTTGLTVTLLTPPFAQQADYHQFADNRALLGIPWCMDVISNLGFMLAGLSGLFFQRRFAAMPYPFNRWLPWYCLSLIAVGLGSIYYHLAPSNHTLLWDRLPMTVTFSLFFCLVMASHVSINMALRMLPVMIVSGIASTLYWYTSEVNHAGDLRFYAAFQFLPMLLAILMLIQFPATILKKRWLTLTLAMYALAKILEHADIAIFSHTGFISGHTLKHLVAAIGACGVILSAVARYAFSRRSPFPESETAR